MVLPSRRAANNACSRSGAGRAGGEHVVELGRRDDRDAVGVAHDPVARATRATSPTLAGPPTPPGGSLVAPAQGDHRGEHREAVRLERADVTHATVDHETGDPARLRRRS